MFFQGVICAFCVAESRFARRALRNKNWGAISNQHLSTFMADFFGLDRKKICQRKIFIDAKDGLISFDASIRWQFVNELYAKIIFKERKLEAGNFRHFASVCIIFQRTKSQGIIFFYPNRWDLMLTWINFPLQASTSLYIFFSID